MSNTKKFRHRKVSDLSVLRVNMGLLSLRPIFVFPHHGIDRRPCSDKIKPSSHVFTFDVSRGRHFLLHPEWGCREGLGELGGLAPW